MPLQLEYELLWEYLVCQYIQQKNSIRISNLSTKVQEELVSNRVTFGQVKPLIVLEHNLQDKILEDIVKLVEKRSEELDLLSQE